ncbi:MAG TPA: MBL fold metallo-hydrolase [bacterium]
MKIHVLASGSKGNCALIEARGVRLLVDAGLSGAEIERRLAALGVDAGDLAAVLITHEHADHVRGAGILARRHRLPVYLTRGTHAAERRHLGELPFVEHVEPGREFEIRSVGVRPFSTPHTRQGGGFADPVAYCFFAGGAKAGYATDLGHPTGLMAQHLAGCRLLVLEFNHDPGMLADGPYPWPVKQWIRGQGGHLSNEQAARLLERVLHEGLEGLVLAHLSETNNTPELAHAAAREALVRCRLHERVELRIACPDATVTIALRR